jgi:hypothetical protein
MNIRYLLYNNIIYEISPDTLNVQSPDYNQNNFQFFPVITSQPQLAVNISLQILFSNRDLRLLINIISDHNEFRLDNSSLGERIFSEI